MRAGKSCLTRTFFTHIAMVLSSNVLMECCGEYFHEFLRIQLIILKSKFFVGCSTTFNCLSIYRVLIATIKDMGLCPCPRCFTLKGSFSSLGLLRDMKSRITNLRVYVIAKVLKAREFISSGSTVGGAKVEHSLGEGSWVPVLVSAAASFLPFGR
jgi:hypothetical protein